MKVRTYYQHLLRMNQEELPQLPPFAADQGLSPDELMDIILFGTPKSWSREMDRQGFDPLNMTIVQVVDFLEQIETAEDFEGNVPKRTTTNQSSKKKSYAKGEPKSGDQKHCSIHGWGGHSSAECYKLQGEAKRRRGEGSGAKKEWQNKTSNKTWTRKADDGRNQSKKELASFQKAVKAGVQKELASMDKKRKAAKGDIELHAFDAELKDFNYEDMDDLKIDSDDEVSIDC
jgi:hypothetical protein